MALIAPSAAAEAGEHADWLELSTLTTADRNSSFEDLARTLRSAGSADAIGDDEDASPSEIDPRSEITEAIASDAFAELDDRSVACRRSAYPYQVAEDVLQANRRPDLSTYTFLLLLSTYGKDAGPSNLNGERLFEDISAVA